MRCPAGQCGARNAGPRCSIAGASSLRRYIYTLSGRRFRHGRFDARGDVLWPDTLRLAALRRKPYMKNFLGLALVASLLAAPAVMAQTTAPAKPKTAPPNTPADTKPSGGGSEQPATATPQPGPSAKVGGKNGTGVVNGAPEAKQEGKGAAPAAAGEAAKKAMDESAKAGPNHKLLEWFEGEWQVEVKDLTPGQESTDKGVMTGKMVYGGRFLQNDYDGRFHGKFFRGGGMMGYNNNTKKFENTWADSRDTAISFMTGTISADNKVLTFTGETTDPTSGKKAATREIDRITGKDSYTGEFYMGDMKIMELSYVRGKAADKKDDSTEKKADMKVEKKDDKKDVKKDEKPKTK